MNTATENKESDKKIIKGDFGYLKAQKKKEIIKTVLFFLASFVIFGIGYLISGSEKNILTVAAVLGLLPASKSVVILIMFIKATPHACPQETYERTDEFIAKTGLPFTVYDLYMTSEKNDFPIYCMSCRGKYLIGFSSDPKLQQKEATEHIRGMLDQNGFHKMSIHIFTKYDAYLERMKALANFETDAEGKCDGVSEEHDLEVLKLMLNISL